MSVRTRSAAGRRYRRARPSVSRGLWDAWPDRSEWYPPVRPNEYTESARGLIAARGPFDVVAHLTFADPVTLRRAHEAWGRWVRDVASVAGSLARRPPCLRWACAVEWRHGRDRPHLHALLGGAGVADVPPLLAARRWVVAGGGSQSVVEPVRSQVRVVGYVTKGLGCGEALFDMGPLIEQP